MSRLVIRIKLPSREPPQAPRRSSRGALLLIAGALAVVVLILVGISMFRTEPTPAPAAAPSAPAPVVSHEPPVEPEVQKQPAGPASPVNQVIPDVPRNALNTIRGMIRITIRVTIDEEGKVLDATTVEPGPSRYFERLATEAARKWTFTPTDSDQQRVMLVRFYLKRSGVTAGAESVR